MTVTFAESHQMTSRIEVLVGGGGATELAIAAGSVAYDRRAAIRRRLNLTIAGHDLVPDSAESLLAPYGNTIAVGRGVIDENGASYEPLGVYRIEKTTVTEDGLKILGFDRSAIVNDDLLLEPVAIHDGLPLAGVILALIVQLIPDATLINRAPDGYVTASAQFAIGTNRWGACQQLARAAGLALYVDRYDRFVLEPERTLRPETSAAVFAEGEGGILVGASKEWSRESTHNAVLAIGNGDATTGPVQALATIASGSFRWGGRFGRKPRIYRSEHIANNAQAGAAAAAVLEGEQGAEQSVSFDVIPDPRRDVGEVVTILRTKLGIAEPHLIETLKIPLTHDVAMTGTTRTSLTSSTSAATIEGGTEGDPNAAGTELSWNDIHTVAIWSGVHAYNTWDGLQTTDVDGV